MKNAIGILIAIIAASCNSNVEERPSGLEDHLKDTAVYVLIEEIPLIGPSGKKDLVGKIQDTVKIWSSNGEFSVSQSGVRLSPQRSGSDSRIPIKGVEFTGQYDREQERLSGGLISQGIKFEGNNKLSFVNEPNKVYERID